MVASPRIRQRFERFVGELVTAWHAVQPEPPAELSRGEKGVLELYAAGGRHFDGVQLAGANLAGAKLDGAKFFGANLNGANLQRASLNGANLYRANLEHANLSSAELVGAKLHGTDLLRADLSGANATSAKLLRANLEHANLQRATLPTADLRRANLTNANLSGADLSGADLSGTLLVGIDLAPFIHADPPVVHLGPSYVDFTSVAISLHHPRLKDFLVRTGMPELVVDNMVDTAMALGTNVFRMMRSTFISYGGPDEAFARKLYEALHKNGVTTFFFPEHAIPGQKLHDVMRDGVNQHERVILICSKGSLDRRGVANEIEEVLAREARDGGATFLIPITIDDYVFADWKPPKPGTAQAVRDRVVADFRGADADPAKFSAALMRLIQALKK